MALFELTSGGFVKTIIYDYEYRALSLWGNYLFFVFFITYNIIYSFYYSFFTKRRLSQYPIRDHLHKYDVDRLFTIISIITYVLSFICLITGISNMMTGPKIVLPFHINGLIDELRGNIYPFIFAIYLFDVLKNGRKMPSKNILLFLIYAVLEIFIRQSKGALIQSFLPAFVIAGFVGRVNKRVLFRYVFPMLVFFIAAYPIVEILRQDGNFSVSAINSAVKTSRTSTPEEKSSPYIRAFLSGLYYVKLVDDITPDYLSFDLRRAPTLFLMGGGVNYMTYEIDGFSENDGISSGVTGLNDALLWGGYMLCWIVLAFIVIIAFYADNGNYVKKRIIYKVIFFFFLYLLLAGRTITLLIDHVVLATIMNIVMKVFIAHYYYKRLY